MFKTSVSGWYMFSFGNFTIHLSWEAYGKMVTYSIWWNKTVNDIFRIWGIDVINNCGCQRSYAMLYMMRNADARTCSSRQETFNSNGGHDTWFGDFKHQIMISSSIQTVQKKYFCESCIFIHADL